MKKDQFPSPEGKLEALKETESQVKRLFGEHNWEWEETNFGSIAVQFVQFNRRGAYLTSKMLPLLQRLLPDNKTVEMLSEVERRYPEMEMPDPEHDFTNGGFYFMHDLDPLRRLAWSTHILAHLYDKQKKAPEVEVSDMIEYFDRLKQTQVGTSQTEEERVDTIAYRILKGDAKLLDRPWVPTADYYRILERNKTADLVHKNYHAHIDTAVYTRERSGSKDIDILKSNLDQILSTFKFTEPTIDPTANWQTYTNSTYHYLLKYPQGYTIPPQGVREISQLGIDTQACVTDSKSTCIIPIHAGTQNSLTMVQFTATCADTPQVQTLNGNQWTYCTDKNISGNKDYFIIHGNNYYEIEIALNNETLFRNVINTFKFTY